MSKKSDGKFDKSKPDISKIWCPDKEGFQYTEACDKNCKKKINVWLSEIILSQDYPYEIIGGLS
jgi:hypothetical protein